MKKLWNKIMRSMYDWTMKLAGGDKAVWALCAVAFIESSFFPIPPDLLLIPLILARRTQAFRLALLATSLFSSTSVQNSTLLLCATV